MSLWQPLNVAQSRDLLKVDFTACHFNVVKAKAHSQGGMGCNPGHCGWSGVGGKESETEGGRERQREGGRLEG